MARWTILPRENAVVWNVKPGELHTDDMEMAGFGCSVVVTYGVDGQGFVLRHHPVFPTLRLRPNNTHASYQMDVPPEMLPRLLADGEPVTETLCSVKLYGIVELATEAGSLTIRRLCFPSSSRRAA
ncbi:MAG: hypothetical protein IKZ41_03635, partial [Clostridia bacterium]|nr:hypothetical protein [Clostridia bacterium]